MAGLLFGQARAHRSLEPGFGLLFSERPLVYRPRAHRYGSATGPHRFGRTDGPLARPDRRSPRLGLLATALCRPDRRDWDRRPARRTGCASLGLTAAAGARLADRRPRPSGSAAPGAGLAVVIGRECHAATIGPLSGDRL